MAGETGPMTKGVLSPQYSYSAKTNIPLWTNKDQPQNVPRDGEEIDYKYALRTNCKHFFTKHDNSCWCMAEAGIWLHCLMFRVQKEILHRQNSQEDWDT